MLGTSNLKFGTVIYVVNEKNNVFTKQRITMIDQNGVEWYRYDRDHWEYTISELIYCGHVAVTITGEVDYDPMRQNEMYFKYPDGNIHGEYEADVRDCQEWFHTREEAEAYIELLKKEML